MCEVVQEELRIFRPTMGLPAWVSTRTTLLYMLYMDHEDHTVIRSASVSCEAVAQELRMFFRPQMCLHVQCSSCMDRQGAKCGDRVAVIAVLIRQQVGGCVAGTGDSGGGVTTSLDVLQVLCQVS